MKRNHFISLLWGLAIIVPAVALVILGSAHKEAIHQAQAHNGTKEEFKKWADQKVADWVEKPYISLDDRDTVVSAVRGIQIQGEPLAPDIRAAYSDALLDFLYAYNTGGLDRWRAFRFTSNALPHSLSAKGVFDVKVYFGLIKTQAVPGIIPRDKVFKQNWVHRVLANTPPAVSNDNDLESLFYKCMDEITYSNIYAGYFKGVCIQDAIVKHDIYTAVPKPLDQYPFFPTTVQNGYAADAPFPNEGYWHWDNSDEKLSYFIVHPTLNELLSKSKRVDCINTFIFIQLNEPGKATPILLRHVWNPDIRCWVISELVDGNLFGSRVQRLFL